MILSHSYKTVFCFGLFLSAGLSLFGCGGGGSSSSGLPYWLNAGSTIVVNVPSGTHNAQYLINENDAPVWRPVPANIQFMDTITLNVLGPYRGLVVCSWVKDGNSTFIYEVVGQDTFNLTLSCARTTIKMTSGKMNNANEPGKGNGTIGSLSYSGVFEIIDEANGIDPPGINCPVKFNALNCPLTHSLNKL